MNRSVVWWLCAMLLLVSAVFAAVVDDEDEDEILLDSYLKELDTSNFMELTSEGRWFVRIYNTECSVCNILHTHWENLSEHAKKFDMPFKMGQMVANDNLDLCHLMKVTNLPALLVIEDGKYYHYADTTHDMLHYLEFAKKGYAEEDGYMGYLNVAERPADPDIIELTDANFDDSVAEGKWMVMFYGAMCGYCKEVMPMWRKLARYIKFHQFDLNVAMIEANENKQSTHKWSAFPYPAIFLFEDGRPIRMEDSRTVYSLEEYLSWADNSPAEIYAAEAAEAEKQLNEEL